MRMMEQKQCFAGLPSFVERFACAADFNTANVASALSGMNRCSAVPVFSAFSPLHKLIRASRRASKGTLLGQHVSRICKG